MPIVHYDLTAALLRFSSEKKVKKDEKKEQVEEDDDDLSFELSDDEKEGAEGIEGGAEEEEEAEIEVTESSKEREEKLMEMIYECATAREVAAYIDSLESTLLAARGREYQLRIEEKRGQTTKTEASAASAMVPYPFSISFHRQHLSSISSDFKQSINIAHQPIDNYKHTPVLTTTTTTTTTNK